MHSAWVRSLVTARCCNLGLATLHAGHRRALRCDVLVLVCQAAEEPYIHWHRRAQLCGATVNTLQEIDSASVSVMAERADDKEPSDGTEKLLARARIASLKSFADCEIRVGCVVYPHLHKLLLALESGVLR